MQLEEARDAAAGASCDSHVALQQQEKGSKHSIMASDIGDYLAGQHCGIDFFRLLWLSEQLWRSGRTMEKQLFLRLENHFLAKAPFL